uniref:Uncharacterized protein n=1 Tax=Esox lucius TaxID=8010 RepID=A0A6Q2ZAZ9_ESOLU
MVLHVFLLSQSSHLYGLSYFGLTKPRSHSEHMVFSRSTRARPGLCSFRCSRRYSGRLKASAQRSQPYGFSPTENTFFSLWYSFAGASCSLDSECLDWCPSFSLSLGLF